MRYLFGLLSLALIVATALPLLRHDDWWIRVFDFPRGQIVIGCALALIGMAYFANHSAWLDRGVMLLLGLSLVYQVFMMLPYTVAWPRQVQATDAMHDNSISILIANVLMDNRNFEGLRNLINDRDPDVVFAVETDNWWTERLSELEDAYPYTVAHPLDNTYGLTLLSRLPLEQSEVRFLVEDEVPSIKTTIRLRSGEGVAFYGLHPKPPAPDESEETQPRDAELVLVGREARELDQPVIVSGDLNDVAWSRTTKLFQSISGLLDPRRGRGMYNTYNAKNPLFRWPLDHIFHSDHFRLVHLERLPKWGSDHFAVLVHLTIEADAPAEVDEPSATEDEQEAAEEILQDGDATKRES